MTNLRELAEAAKAAHAGGDLGAFSEAWAAWERAATPDAFLALYAERDEAQSTCTAWQDVFEGIEAHLQDRIAMKDDASPATYLDIIRSAVARIIQTSRQIVNARWADYRRNVARAEAAEASLSAERAEVERLRDKVEGLTADIESAVEVAFKRGATDWTRLNYPTQYEALTKETPHAG